MIELYFKVIMLTFERLEECRARKVPFSSVRLNSDRIIDLLPKKCRRKMIGRDRVAGTQTMPGWRERVKTVAGTDIIKSAQETRDELGSLSLNTGDLTLDQINLVLTHLPVDLTFVDENDRVAYYSEGPERIFPRSPGIIGREIRSLEGESRLLDWD